MRPVTTHSAARWIPLLLVLWGLSAPCPAQRVAEWIGGTVYDFGRLDPMGPPATHRFLVRNVGREPWRIEGARSGCGCTTALHSAEAVQPGDTAWVLVSYDPSLAEPGRFRQRVVVAMSGAARGAVLFVRGTVGEAAGPTTERTDRDSIL